MSGIISLDTETTGLDLFHGCMPFAVDICYEDGSHELWEWLVDPLTRKPDIPYSDKQEILDRIAGCEEIILQNSKFDAIALMVSDIVPEWPWYKTQDTIISGHLLGSNLRHNLTDMVVQYLGHDILPLEKNLEEAVKSCRREIQQARLRIKNNKPGNQPNPISQWKIAEEGLSIGDTVLLPSYKK